MTLHGLWEAFKTIAAGFLSFMAILTIIFVIWALVYLYPVVAGVVIWLLLMTFMGMIVRLPY